MLPFHISLSLSPAYCRNAVKRFVYDNQGMVRRMYGDLRHIFVMQSELENEIDFGDIQHTADKYSKAFNTHNNQRQARSKKATADGGRKNYRSGDASEPHFRPAQRPSATNTKQRTKPTKLSATDEKSSLIDNLIQTNVDALGGGDELKGKLEKITTTTVKSSSSSSSSSTTAAVNSDDDQLESETIGKAEISLDLFGNISSVLSASTTTTLKTSTTQRVNDTTEVPVIREKNKEIFEEVLEESIEQAIVDKMGEISFADGESLTEATFSADEPTASEKLDEKEQTSKDPAITTTTEAQLFQDSVLTTNRRGV